jgi:N12 class adenine-specific DNA methylase
MHGESEAWFELKTIETEDGPATINEYFVNHPDRMLGTPTLDGNLYQAREFSLSGSFCSNRFAVIIAQLPSNIYAPASPQYTVQVSAALPACELESIKDGAYGLANNRLVIRNGNALEPVTLSSAVETRIRAHMRARDAVRDVTRSWTTLLKRTSSVPVII